MIRIDTDVPEIIVEIDDKEYTLAPRTVEIMEKLAEAERINEGKPAYRMWLAELEILLGKEACRELFNSGRHENVDRVQMIYMGVARAFQHTDNAVVAEAREKDFEAVATALAPLNEMLKHLRALEKNDEAVGSNIRNIREIRRS